MRNCLQFRSNCAACHSATGAGGALSYGRAAPPRGKSAPRVVASAIRMELLLSKMAKTKANAETAAHRAHVLYRIQRGLDEKP